MKKLYLFFIAVLFVAVAYAQDYKVAVISERLPDADAIVAKFLSEIEGMDGYTSVHLPMADMATATWSNYDAAIVTENGGSGSMGAYQSGGWVLPTVHLKIYGIDNNPNGILSEANFVSGDKSSDLFPGVTDLVVKDNADILSCWDIDAVVTWTEAFNTTIGTGAGEAHVQGFDMSAASNPQAAVVAAAVLLAESPLAPPFSHTHI